MFESINGVYAGLAAGGAVLCTALYALRLRAHRKKYWLAFVTLVLSAVLGVGLAKVFYLLMTLTTYLSRHGFPLSAPAEWSFFGGMMGVYLGVWLCGKMFKEDTFLLLQLFAPIGMLLIAVLRAGEFALDQLGLGEMVENTAVQFFPVCWPISLWGRQTWFMAIFAWEAAWALIVGLWCAVRQIRRGVREGNGLYLSLFLAGLGQMLFESLRSEAIRLGFVRLEQVLSAVLCFSIVLILCRKCDVKKSVLRWLPAILILCGIGAMVGLEFALDEPSYTRWVVYALMILVLALMGAVYFWAEKRVLKATGKEHKN